MTDIHVWLQDLKSPDTAWKEYCKLHSSNNQLCENVIGHSSEIKTGVPITHKNFLEEKN